MIDALIRFLSDPEWLIPLALSFVVQTTGPHYFKGYLPQALNGSRAFWIRTGSVLLGQAAFISARWSILTVEGRQFQLADMVLAGWVGFCLILLVPFVYDLMPRSFKDKYSYTQRRKERMKGVMTAEGLIEERPATQPLGDGETTVIQPYDRTEVVDIGRPDDTP